MRAKASKLDEKLVLTCSARQANGDGDSQVQVQFWCLIMQQLGVDGSMQCSVVDV